MAHEAERDPAALLDRWIADYDRHFPEWRLAMVEGSEIVEALNDAGFVITKALA